MMQCYTYTAWLECVLGVGRGLGTAMALRGGMPQREATPSR